MKKQRHWLFFEKDAPENDWEAKYLTDRYKTNNWVGVVLFGFFVLLISIFIMSISIHPCEIDFDISGNGTLTFSDEGKMGEISDVLFDKFILNGLSTRAKVSGPCLSLFLFRGMGN